MLTTVRCLFLAGLLAVFGLCLPATAQDKKKDDLKSMLVDLDGVKSEAPKDWKREKPANLLRSYQFRLPKAEGDKDDAELSIRGQIGNDEAAIAQTKKMFVPPEGKKIDEFLKTEKMKIGGGQAIYLDLQGTYLKKEKPIDPDTKAMKVPNYRVLRVLLQTKIDAHDITMIGPAKTVEQHKKAFDEWLKNFK